MNQNIDNELINKLFVDEQMNIDEKIIGESSEIFIEDIDDFLKSFSINFFDDFYFLNEIKNKIEDGGQTIGEPSAIGSIYEIEDEDYIIKKSNYCPTGGSRIQIINTLCDMAKNGDLVFRIANTNINKTVIFAPNYITEPIIGIYMNKLTKKYTSSFMKTLNFQYDRTNPEKSVYIISEKLENINNYVGDIPSYLYFIFQIVHGLNIGQKMAKFVHYDLHQNNVMARKNINNINIYPIENGTFLYTKFDFDSVMIDFGFSRMETKNCILTLRALMRGANRMDFMDHYEFNPYYDLFCLLYTNSVKLLQEEPSAELTEISFKLFELFLNAPKENTNQFINNYLEHVKINNWRPYPERLNTKLEGIEWNNPSNPSEMLAKIVNLIDFYVKSPSITNPQEIDQFLDQNKFFVSDQLIKLNNAKIFKSLSHSKTMDNTFYSWQNFNHANTPESFKNITISSFHDIPIGVNNEIKNYHHTLPNSVINNNNFSNQKINIVEIDQEKGIQNNYKFNFDCCRLDVRNFFQNKNIDSGVAVNAGFFNIFSNFSPIGEFKNNDLYFNNEINQKYKNHYGIVGIDINGYINIDDKEKRGKYKQYITCGPRLVKDGEIIFTEDIFDERDDNGTYIWQCRKATNNENIRDEIFEDNIPNCNYIKPGELSHSSNPNPRTALGIKHDRSVVMFYIEGRDKRGSGVDMVQLAQICSIYGCVDAINFDGGISSRIVWKKPGESVLNQFNPELDFMYPVGNILSFTKRNGM